MYVFHFCINYSVEYQYFSESRVPVGNSSITILHTGHFPYSLKEMHLACLGKRKLLGHFSSSCTVMPRRRGISSNGCWMLAKDTACIEVGALAAILKAYCTKQKLKSFFSWGCTVIPKQTKCKGWPRVIHLLEYLSCGGSC